MNVRRLKKEDYWATVPPAPGNPTDNGSYWKGLLQHFYEKDWPEYLQQEYSSLRGDIGRLTVTLYQCLTMWGIEKDLSSKSPLYVPARRLAQIASTLQPDNHPSPSKCLVGCHRLEDVGLLTMVSNKGTKKANEYTLSDPVPDPPAYV